MRLAAVLLLIGTLFGVAPTTAQAAPTRDSVSYIALSSKRGAGAFVGHTISKVGGYHRSRANHYSHHYHHGSPYTRRRNIPLWQTILVLLALGCFAVWVVVKLVRKLRKRAAG